LPRFLIVKLRKIIKLECFITQEGWQKSEGRDRLGRAGVGKGSCDMANIFSDSCIADFRVRARGEALPSLVLHLSYTMDGYHSDSIDVHEQLCINVERETSDCTTSNTELFSWSPAPPGLELGKIVHNKI
jgi:hypothetical protein